ncbi:hypothetical protein PUNSTDRAFT_115895 [Punctularia strigosozonata HHB-11173 SS5]|uniref:uncharacterized protein n=1 Tax=Punctularia strigosozonata (strain HHB-11173) TaxID=741275 RepID=UPI0004416EFB|nr:uncharacterized protein PUNSTDRAFT_115895 [Punctularia strigosozonata HHB-11173 SS5]EIN05451.1 hypothetical protein PUNSTDRAFT_115895 [Punctularia strigosozonata HHB-11173 SS5]
MFKLQTLLVASTCLLLDGALSLAQSNLPDLGTGVFEVSTRILIDAPLETVWNTILDFPRYPDWNPFSRSQVVCDDLFVPLANQTAFEGARIIINVQIPPLTPPVNRSTPSNLLHTQISFENITHLQPDLHRVAWKQIDIPDIAVNATRWQAVSTVGNQTLYESAEVYGGGLAGAVELLYGTGLQEAFDAQGVALKALLEGTS